MKQVWKVRCESPRNLGLCRASKAQQPLPAGADRNAAAPVCRFCRKRTDFPDFPFPNAPGKGGHHLPIRPVLDKVGQNWPNLAKLGHGWPNLDKAGQKWTAGGQVFQPFYVIANTLWSVKHKLAPLFLAGLRGSASNLRPAAGTKRRKTAQGNPRLVHELPDAYGWSGLGKR